VTDILLLFKSLQVFLKIRSTQTILTSLGLCITIKKITFQNDFVWSNRKNKLKNLSDTVVYFTWSANSHEMLYPWIICCLLGIIIETI